MLSPGKYYAGASLRLKCEFQDDTGADTNPTTVLLRLMSPSGYYGSFTYGTDTEMGRSSTGNYYADVIPNETGRWLARWEGTSGTVVVVVEQFFNIQASAFYDSWGSDYRRPL